VKYLVDELGVDVKWKDEKGFTPLHSAAVVGENEIILYLVSKGADPKARAKMVGVADGVRHDTEEDQGETVADMANGPFQRAIVYPDTVELLEKLGSANSHNCRAAACLNPNRPAKNADKPKP
jgi:ankyrin repeat protein